MGRHRKPAATRPNETIPVQRSGWLGPRPAATAAARPDEAISVVRPDTVGLLPAQRNRWPLIVAILLEIGWLVFLAWIAFAARR